MFDGEANVVRADGSTILMKKNPDETELKNFIMPADGEVLDIKKLQK